jgi:hypothetical protein
MMTSCGNENEQGLESLTRNNTLERRDKGKETGGRPRCWEILPEIADALDHDRPTGNEIRCGMESIYERSPRSLVRI